MWKVMTECKIWQQSLSPLSRNIMFFSINITASHIRIIWCTCTHFVLYSVLSTVVIFLNGVNGEERGKRGDSVMAAKKLHNAKGKENKFMKSGRPQWIINYTLTYSHPWVRQSLSSKMVETGRPFWDISLCPCSFFALVPRQPTLVILQDRMQDYLDSCNRYQYYSSKSLLFMASFISFI